MAKLRSSRSKVKKGPVVIAMFVAAGFLLTIYTLLLCISGEKHTPLGRCPGAWKRSPAMQKEVEEDKHP